MPNSTRSSAASAHSRPGSVPEARIEWRPSRWLLTAILALGVLAACSLLASEMPRAAAWPAALAALGYGVWLFRREARQPARSFVFRGDAAPVRVDGEPATDFELQWRGPLAFASWRGPRGRRCRCAWWPDTLPPARRRELRLAAPAGRAARRGTSMAP